MRGYPHTFYMQRTSHKQKCSIAALDDEGRRLESSDLKHLPMPVPGAHSVLVVSHEMGRDWTGRFVVVNGYVGRRRELELRFAQNIMRQVGPALYSVYLFRHFRSRAGAVERARVARELHDTVIQSLIGIEMQLDVLRRKGSHDSQLPAELHRIQGLLRQEVLTLRELMQTMRPPDVGRINSLTLLPTRRTFFQRHRCCRPLCLRIAGSHASRDHLPRVGKSGSRGAGQHSETQRRAVGNGTLRLAKRFVEAGN